MKTPSSRSGPASFRSAAAGFVFALAAATVVSGCASSSSSSSSQKPAEVKQTPAKTEPNVSGSNRGASEGGTAVAARPAVQTKDDIALSMTPESMVGNWTGEDARSIVGTLRLCAGGQALIVVNGETLGQELGPNVTWTVAPVRPGVAQLQMSINGEAGEKTIGFLVRRPSERRIDLVIVPVTAENPKFADAAPRDIVSLQREAGAPNCQTP